MPLLSLNPHPRTYIDNQAVERLTQTPELPILAAAAETLAARAERWRQAPPLEYPRNTHNEYLRRARACQYRVLTLLGAWVRTAQADYRAAAMEYLRQMGQWECWSWIARRKGDCRPEAIFDLSYGENACTLATAYSLLHETLSEAERTMLLATAQKWIFPSARVNFCDDRSFWYARPDSNWNTVCAGGLGMAVLAMHEHVDDAEDLLDRVEESIEPFFKSLNATAGGWPEGIGYWNFGMLYGFRYLLTYEAAAGEAHPLMSEPGLKQTLAFPGDFCPGGRPCSFGDVNRWSPMPVHYAMCLRLGADEVRADLDFRLKTLKVGGSRPVAFEWLALHPGQELQDPQPTTTRRRFYPGLDWGVLADRLEDPRLYLAVRGGTTNVPHGHRDLLSFHAVADGEIFFTDMKPAEYLDTTFSPRREEILEIRPDVKNTLLVNGVGITEGSQLDRTEPVDWDGPSGFRLEATTAFGEMRDGPAVDFAGRLALLLDDRALLVVDSVILPHPGRVEARAHTPAAVGLGAAAGEPAWTARAALTAGQAGMQVAWASNIECVLLAADPCPTTPKATPMKALRWCTADRLHKQVHLAMLMHRGTEPATVEIEPTEGQSMTVTARCGDWQRRLPLTDRLTPAGEA